MKRIVLFLCLITLFSSCRQEKVISQEQYNQYAEQIGLLLPDSLKTPEQIQIKEEMTEIIFSKTEVRKNRMHLTVGREYFVEQGLPDFCYDMAVFDHNNTNKVIEEIIKDSDIQIDLEETFREAQKEFLNR